MAGDDADPEAPPSPAPNKVEIHVAGHVIVVESTDPLADVVGYALGLHQQTAHSARHIPIGFDATGGQFERAEPYIEPGSVVDPGEDERAR